MENTNTIVKTGNSSILEFAGMRFIACTLNGVSTLGILMGYSISGLSIIAFPRSLSTDSSRCMILIMSSGTFINLDQPIYVENHEGVRSLRVYYDHMQNAVVNSRLFSKIEINKFIWFDAPAVCSFVNDN